jgi:Trk K+ transport system NAD-binding subunit
MLFVLSRLFARLLTAPSWVTPLAVVAFVFATSWPLMTLAEPPGSELVHPANYWWYFVVTAATVGYGDLYPATGAGHAVGAYVIVGGIATLTTVFARLATALERAKGRRMKGAVTVRTTGHTVLLGYTPGRTERLVDHLRGEDAGELVLCAWDDVAAHPMPERTVTFIRGELDEPDVLRRAGVPAARTVLIDARDDNEALAIAVAVAHVSAGAHVVVTLRDMQRAERLHYLDQRIRCVQWHTPRMIIEELTSPGIAEVYTELMTSGGPNTYSTPLPDSLGALSVAHCQTSLGRHHGATLLAAHTGDRMLVNPGWDTRLPAGATLYYVCDHRLTAGELTRALHQPESSAAP